MWVWLLFEHFSQITKKWVEVQRTLSHPLMRIFLRIFSFGGVAVKL